MFINFLGSLQGFELASVTVLTGVLTATFILRVCGTNPGGILGAAFVLLAASDSVWWAVSLLIVAPIISWVYGHFLSRIYAGREPIFIMAGMSIPLTTMAGMALQYYHIIPQDSFSFPLGVIAPAIIASAIRKQGLAHTYRYLLLAILLTLESVIIIHAIGQWFDYDFMALARLARPRQMLELSWSSLFSIASVIIGYSLYRIFRVKAAGFIILPLLATIAVVSPLNLLLLLATATLVYGLTCLIRRHSLVIGTSRYALVSALSITAVWTISYVLLHYTSQFSPYMGTGLFAALAVSVLVNEHSIYGVAKTLPVLTLGLAAMVIVEVGASWAVATINHSPHSISYYVIRHSVDPGRRQ